MGLTKRPREKLRIDAFNYRVKFWCTDKSDQSEKVVKSF